MSKVAVITGGAGGMGFAVAKILGRDHQLLICDVHQERLDTAVNALRKSGMSCDAMVCDITDRSAVEALFQRAESLGQVVCAVHTAGVSPQMASPETIMRVNALGTIHVTESAHAIASKGFALVNVASMAGYMLPSIVIPRRAYSYALTDTETFLKKSLFPCRFMTKAFHRKGMAYSISKHFVMWYCKKMAAKFGEKAARIVSVSPGSFDTDMGRLEEKSGSAEMLKTAALKRFGKTEEIAELLAFCVSDKAGYLTGTDILCDGGVMASKG